MTTTQTMAVYINNGPAMIGTLSIDQEQIPVFSNLPEPNPRWEHTDSNGHWHAHSDDADDRYPTLKRHIEHAECDGSCGGVCQGEGYSTVRYTCRICDETIEPSTIPGPHHHTLPGRRSWTADVHGRIQLGGRVTIRVETEDIVYFGLAECVSTEGGRFGPDADAVEFTSYLVGVGPLGRRGT